jgi:hypothetical protein
MKRTYYAYSDVVLLAAHVSCSAMLLGPGIETDTDGSNLVAVIHCLLDPHSVCGNQWVGQSRSIDQ